MFNVFQQSSGRASRGVANRRYACVRAYECVGDLKLSGKHFSVCAAMFAELLGETWNDGKHPSINAFASLRLTLERNGKPPFWEFACEFVTNWILQNGKKFEAGESVRMADPSSAKWGGDGNRELESFEWKVLEPGSPMYEAAAAETLEMVEAIQTAGGAKAFAEQIQYVPRVR